MDATIAVAMSGGIDSLVSAALLKDRGYRLLGVHFLTGYESTSLNANQGSSVSWDEIHDHASQRLRSLSHQLDIPIHIIDLHKEFKSKVVAYFVQTYQKGKTPNPCLMCNPSIKFNILYKQAQSLGADQIATGHYARNVIDADGRRRLFRAVDQGKDQSYFLARLSQKQLARAVFPLAALTKKQTLTIASDKGLQPLTTKESQDICFIENARYGNFLSQQPGFESSPGPIEDVQGRVIGRHNGLHLFTIGQRKGINCPAAYPYYVVRMDVQRNCLVVGSKHHLLSGKCRVEQINWIIPPPDRPLKISAQIRYRHKAVAATLTPVDRTSAMVAFDRPEPAVTPGQGAVFYRDDEVLGGGWIE